MDAHLETQKWDEVDRYAAALDEYTRPEPLPWSDFMIRRGRALAAYGRGNCTDSTLETLRQLHDEAERVGLRITLPALEAALVKAS